MSGDFETLEINQPKITYLKAEDGIRDQAVSRGLGDVYKRQTFLTVTERKLSNQKLNFRD